MKYGTLLIILLFVIGISLVCYLYFFKELPKQEEIDKKSHANIYSYNEDGMKTKTGYKIIVNGNEYSNGTTSIVGGVRERVPLNRSIKVENYNLEDQSYYIDSKEFRALKDNHRVDLELKEIGNFVIDKYENLSDDKKNVSLYLTTDSYLKKINFCIRRSNNFLYTDVISKNWTKIENPVDYEFYDKCYKTDVELEENDLILIKINYLLFDRLKSDDNLEFIFFSENKEYEFILQ